jgi:lipoate-protein ligase A
MGVYMGDMMKWRFIPYKENDAFLNMAIDEAVSESVGSGESLPTIRFWGWVPRAVSIGYFQSLQKEIDLEKCNELGVDVVRRRTGGGAVFHDSEITYSIIGKQELFPNDIIASYKEICGCIVNGLARLGIESEFKPINDIITNGKKISGNAQTRRQGVLLQHGTLLYEVDVDKMFSLLKVPDEKIKDKMIATVKERVTSVKAQRNATVDETLAALKSGFADGREVEESGLSEKELARAQELAESKYKSREWNWMR